MKRFVKLICLLLALTAAISLVSCAERDPNVPEGFLLAENEGADYYFYYPETWILNRNDAGMVSTYVSDRDFSNVSVTAFDMSGWQYNSFDQYVKEYYFEQFKDNFNNLNVVSDPEGNPLCDHLTIDGCDATSVRFTAVFAGEEYSFRAWFIERNATLYTVLYTAKTPLFEANLEYATAIATNLQFK